MTVQFNQECDAAYRYFIERNLQKACDIYHEILKKDPENTRALHGLGVVLHASGKSREGISYVTKAVELKPDFIGAYLNLGNIYAEIWAFEEAICCFNKVVQLQPDSEMAYKNLALVLINNRKYDEAYHAGRKALELNPKNSNNYLTLGNVYESRGEIEQALEMYSMACEMDPGNHIPHSNLLFTMNYISRFSQKKIFCESLSWDKLHAVKFRIQRPFLNSPVSTRRIRVGYVSGDFKLHPVSSHFKPVLDNHDRKNFEIFLYSNFPVCDDMSEKLKEIADHWRNIDSLSDREADELIRVDGIDILIDLSGHSGSNRLLLFARKPAPIQISWIGYFNTTGMSAMDYILSDAVTIPLGEDCWFSEKVLRLPNGRFCYEPPQLAPPVSALPALNNRFITFGSFNKLSKLTPETIAAWCSVLKAVPGSRIVLKAAALEAESVKHYIFDVFTRNGVDKGFIELRSESPHAEMLDQYGDIDIALDSFPFNGGATTCDALWMGVPVVTMIGKIPISRQSASLFASCGLSYLVADSLSLFVSLARDLASDLDALANLRRTLRQQLSSSPLCNGRVFTDHLEDVLRKVWYDWCDTHKGLSLKRLHSAISTEEYYNAGVNRMEEKDFRTASQLFVLSGRKRPDFPEAFNNLGICLFNIGKSHHKDAIRYVRKALRINPSFGQAYNNLGLILTETGRGRQALRYCERAVKLMPDNPDARLNIGNVYREKGLYLNALVSYNQALELDPDNFKPYNLIACLKLLYGDPIGAIENFKQANLLQPNDSAIYSNMLFAMNYVSTYSQEDIFEASCTWDRRYGQPTSTSNFENRCANGKRIRVGYVSADFQQHPVGVFFQAVSCNHNRSEFKIFCYSNGSKPDDINKKIRSTVEHWRDVEEMNDIDFSETIRKDEIDILVDLSGHTSGNRLKLFSRRAAPLQVSWLGYFNTTGIANMDYVVTDEVTVPVGCEQWYRETVVRMPHSRFCYTPPFICPDVEQLPALRNGHITFGCFNNIAKLTVEVIEVWAEILRLVPDSRLVLKWKTLSDSSVREYYLSLFSLYGISRQRIEFRGQSTLFMMREEYNDIDIALDPFPFTGGFTSCEALWMGVPVVTLAGERPVSRQTTGLLNVLGLSELSSETIDAYVECAVNISQNLERLTLLRYGMRERMISSPLCNGVEFTERLEAIYRNMYRSWKKNNK